MTNYVSMGDKRCEDAWLLATKLEAELADTQVMKNRAFYALRVIAGGTFETTDDPAKYAHDFLKGYKIEVADQPSLIKAQDE